MWNDLIVISLFLKGLILGCFTACVFRPIAGCGPRGRPPFQGNQFPIRGADGHKGRPLRSSWLGRWRGGCDLLGELARGDRAQADGLAVPLAVDDAVLQMALNYFVSDRHNC